MLFDLDDTLIVSDLDLRALKRELFGRSDGPILETIEGYPPDQQPALHKKLLDIELDRAKTARLNDGAAELLDLLEVCGIGRGIVTRNNSEVVEMVQKSIGVDFGVCICRDDAEPKPSPAPTLLACERAGVTPENTWLVGDYVFDIESGLAAGCFTIYLDVRGEPLPNEPHLRVAHLSEVTHRLRALAG